MEFQLHQWLNSAAVVLGAGGVAGWLREKRKSRTSASDSMLNFVKEWGDQFKEQNRRIDDLNREVGVLTGRLHQITETNLKLVEENTALKSQVLSLRTALQTEAAKAAALAALPRSMRSTDVEG